MKCLVCDSTIRIDSLKQLFSPEPLRLCGRCVPNLVPSKSPDILFENNEWMRSVIDKLNQGDLVLLELFKNPLRKVLLRKEWKNHSIKVERLEKDVPYPWLDILYQQVWQDNQPKKIVPSAEHVTLSVEKEKNTKSQIAILEKI